MLFQFYAHWRASYSGIPRNIWFLSLVTLVNRCGAMVVPFIMLYLKGPLGYDIRHAGYVMGCFGAGALAGSYLGGRLTDRWGYYWVLIGSLVVQGVLLIFLMFFRDFWWMCAAVFSMSLIGEAFRPANSVAINEHSDPETRTRSISLYRMAANMGWAVAPALGGLLVGMGWAWLFCIDGVTCIVAGGLVYYLLPAPASDALPAHASTDDSTSKPTTSPSPFQDRAFMWFVVLTMLNAIVFMQFLWAVPVFFKDGYGWTEQQVGLMVALNGVIVFLVEMPLIYRIERQHPPLYFVRIGLLCYALAYLAFELPVLGFLPALLYTVAISFGEIFVMPFSSNHVFSRMSSDRQGQYVGLYMMAYSLANTIAPLMGTQVIAAWGYSTLWLILSFIAALTWAGVWALERQQTKLSLEEAVIGAEA